jgi:hypothetical protein
MFCCRKYSILATANFFLGDTMGTLVDVEFYDGQFKCIKTVSAEYSSLFKCIKTVSAVDETFYELPTGAKYFKVIH